jgi:predicted dehydrogenase
MSGAPGIGFGLVGTGSIADFHAWAIGQVDGAVLRAVSSRDAAKAGAFAARHGTTAEPDLAALLARPDVAVICVTTPSGAHEEIALAALRAGKHVLCEKPLEISTARIDRMIAAARQGGRWLGAVLPARFSDGAQAMKRAVEQGRFGRLTLCSAQVKWWRSADYYRSGGWRGTWALDGGGALMNQGIHAVDLLQWLAGMPVQVSAFAATLGHEIEVEDTLTAALRFEHGALGTLECATSCAPGAPRRIELCGTRGTATLEDDRIVRWAFDAAQPGDETLLAGQGGSAANSGAADPRAIGVEGHRRVIADMVDALRQNRSPLVAGEEGRRAVALIESIYAAARTARSRG